MFNSLTNDEDQLLPPHSGQPAPPPSRPSVASYPPLPSLPRPPPSPPPPSREEDADDPVSISTQDVETPTTTTTTTPLIHRPMYPNDMQKFGLPVSEWIPKTRTQFSSGQTIESVDREDEEEPYRTYESSTSLSSSSKRFLDLPNDCIGVVLSFLECEKTVLALRSTCLALCRFFDVEKPESVRRVLFHFGTRRKLKSPDRRQAVPEGILPSHKLRWVRRLVIGPGFGFDMFKPSSARSVEALQSQLKEDRECENVASRRMDWKTQGELRVARIPRCGRLADGSGMEGLVAERFPSVEELWIDGHDSGFAQNGVSLRRWNLKKLILYDCSQVTTRVLENLKLEQLRTLKIENGEKSLSKCEINGDVLCRLWPVLVKLHLCHLRSGILVQDRHIRGFQKLEVFVLHGNNFITDVAFQQIGQTLRKLELVQCGRVTPEMCKSLHCIEDVVLRRCPKMKSAEAVAAALREGNLRGGLPRARYQSISLMDLLKSEIRGRMAPTSQGDSSDEDDSWGDEGGEWSY